jgi:hypothetical protein
MAPATGAASDVTWPANTDGSAPAALASASDRIATPDDVVRMIASAPRESTAAGFALAALALACAQAPPAPDGEPPPLPPGALRIELSFGGEADLDLYVSDPDHETVYFANTPARSGGSLEADRRCEDATPRTEWVEWPAPPSGAYRIGVDFPERCRDGVDAAPFTLRILGPGIRYELSGEARFGRFASQVAGFELAPAGSRPDGE